MKTSQLTSAERRMYEFIVDYAARSGGVGPTYREIAAGVGAASISRIGARLERIQRAGLIELARQGRHRRIGPTKVLSPLRLVPVAGENRTIKVPRWMAGHTAFRARDGSNDPGVLPGDVVLVDSRGRISGLMRSYDKERPL